MGVGTRVSERGSLNNVTSLAQTSFITHALAEFHYEGSPPPPFWRENRDYGTTLTYGGKQTTAGEGSEAASAASESRASGMG